MLVDETMQHNEPHATSAFEGYYSKFDLPSGAKIALIVCQVKAARVRPNMLSFTYVPAEDTASKVFQREIWLDELHMFKTAEDRGFVLDLPGIGKVLWLDNREVEYDIRTADFCFKARTHSCTPWSAATDTPEGALVHLPLPLHWHVNSLASDGTFELDIPSRALPLPDRSGNAVVHQEKNWARSFPSAHVWLQARDGARGFCCAGGQIIGMEAFLLGYRDGDFELDFRPPFAMRVAGLSPFMTFQNDWSQRMCTISVQSFRQKIVVRATAPPGTFFSLSSPFEDGHRENYLAQSFRAKIEVRVYASNGLGPWQLVRSDEFHDASLEFGGLFYPPAGSTERFH